MSLLEGYVSAIDNFSVDVTFTQGATPRVLSLLEVDGFWDTATQKPLLLLVVQHLEKHKVRTQALGFTQGLTVRSMVRVVCSELQVRVPVHVHVHPFQVLTPLGYSINGPFSHEQETISLIHQAPEVYGQSVALSPFVATGIKVIDLFALASVYRSTLITGTPSSGKSMLLQELVQQSRCFHDGIACASVGAPYSEVASMTAFFHEFYAEKSSHPSAQRPRGTGSFIIASADDPPALQALTPLIAHAMACRYQKDNERTLLLVDDWGRAIHAAFEATYRDFSASYLVKKPELVSLLEECLSSGRPGNTVWAVMRSSHRLFHEDKLSELASNFDSVIVLDQELAKRGLWPPVNPLHSRSRMLSSELISERHQTLASKALRMLLDEAELQDSVALLGEDSLSFEQQRTWMRARKLRYFLTQPMFTAEQYTAIAGKHVSLEETLDGAESIMNGTYDHMPLWCFLNKGSMDHVLASAQTYCP